MCSRIAIEPLIFSRAIFYLRSQQISVEYLIFLDRIPLLSFLSVVCIKRRSFYVELYGTSEKLIFFFTCMAALAIQRFIVIPLPEKQTAEFLQLELTIQGICNRPRETIFKRKGWRHSDARSAGSNPLTVY